MRKRKQRTSPKTRPTERSVDIFARKVQPVYEVLNWGWQGGPPPTVDEIRGELERQITACLKPETMRAESGGLFSQVEENGDISFGLEIDAMAYYPGEEADELEEDGYGHDYIPPMKPTGLKLYSGTPSIIEEQK
jgi:hypothetical protein